MGTDDNLLTLLHKYNGFVSSVCKLLPRDIETNILYIRNIKSPKYIFLEILQSKTLVINVGTLKD